MPNPRRLAFVLTLGAAVVVAGAGFARRALLHVEPPPGMTPRPVFRGSLRAGGVERTWLAYVPPRPAARPAAVLALHPSTSSGETFRLWTGYELETLADRDGFVVVYPDGLDGAWNDCRGLRAGTALGAFDDVAFLRRLVDRLEESIDVDRRRIFAFGFSNGGQLALRLALEAPDLVAGVAAVAASLPAPGHDVCRPSGRALPVLLAHGTEDPISPFAGGRVSLLGFGDRGDVRSADDTARYFARLATHPGPPRVSHLPDGDGDGSWIERRTWGGRPDEGPEVTLFAVHGGGHAIPQRAVAYPRLLGRLNRDLSVPTEAWAFFARQPSRAGG